MSILRGKSCILWNAFFFVVFATTKASAAIIGHPEAQKDSETKVSQDDSKGPLCDKDFYYSYEFGNCVPLDILLGDCEDCLNSTHHTKPLKCPADEIYSETQGKCVAIYGGSVSETPDSISQDPCPPGQFFMHQDNIGCVRQTSPGCFDISSLDETNNDPYAHIPTIICGGLSSEEEIQDKVCPSGQKYNFYAKQCIPKIDFYPKHNSW